MRRKNIFTSVIATVLVTALSMSSISAVEITTASQKYVLAPLKDVEYYTFNTKKATHEAGRAFAIKANSFSELYSVFLNPGSNNTLKNMYDSNDRNNRKCVFNNTSNFAMMVADPNADSVNLTDSLSVENRSLQIGTANLFKSFTFNLEGGLSVKNGNVLIQNSGTQTGSTTPDFSKQNIQVNLGNPIIIDSNGRLILDGTTHIGKLYDDNEIPVASVLTAPKDDSAIVIKKNGKAEIAYFDVVRSNEDTSNVPLINVESGGSLLFFMSSRTLKTDENGMPIYSKQENLYDQRIKVDLDNGASSSPAVSVADGANVTVEAGDFTAEGDGAIFDLANGATLNLEGGTINNTTKAPAINVNSGATVVIPEDSEAEIKSEKGEFAIDLANGSKVEIAGTAVTVGTDGENYVGNNGVVYLDAGAKVNHDNPLNHAVIFPDGSIVQGTADKKPTVETDPEGTITVTVPDGGSVMGPDGTTTPMPNGGSVSTDGENTTVTPETVPSGGGGGGGSTVKLNPVYRAYNPNNGEHLYTIDEKEYKHVTSLGWHAEDVAFMAEEEKNGQALYRVYNPNSGLHHYTLDENEKNTLISLGWNDEKVAWYTSKKPQSAPVFRVYNPNDGNHHYTMNKQEKDILVSLGWQDEGLAFRTAPIESK